MTGAMGEDGVVQVFQHILLLQPARLHDREDALDEAAACLTPAAEAALAPQYRTTQQPFHEVVGWLHTVRHNKCPQGHLQLQDIGAEAPCGLVRTGLPLCQQPAHLAHDRLHALLQLFPRDRAVLERMPRGKHLFDKQQSLPAQPHAGAAAIDQLLKIAFKVGPANLATLRQHPTVRGQAIRTQNAIDGDAQEARQAGLRPDFFLRTGLGAPSGLADGGTEELVLFVPSRASNAATRCSNTAMRASRARQPGQSEASMLSC